MSFASFPTRSSRRTAIDLTRPRERRRLRGELGLQPNDVLLLSVGRLEENKGFHVLIRALATLVQQKVLPARWKWVLVGDGPRRAQSGARDRIGRA